MIINNTIEPTDLHDKLICQNAPLLIDVRRYEVFQQSADIIASAYWQDHHLVTNWAEQLPQDKEVIVYCAHGEQVSLATSAVLRSMGINAITLSGGIAAWQDNGLPILSKQVWQKYAAKNWLTKQTISLDGLACVWFIKRFVDKAASIIYVQDEWVNDAVIETQSTLFNVNESDTFYCQHNDLCAFDAFITAFAVESDALAYFAKILRAISSNQLALIPEAAGVKAIVGGFLAQKNAALRSQQQMQQHSDIVFDALYQWCQNSPH